MVAVSQRQVVHKPKLVVGRIKLADHDRGWWYQEVFLVYGDEGECESKFSEHTIRHDAVKLPKEVVIVCENGTPGQ